MQPSPASGFIRSRGCDERVKRRNSQRNNGVQNPMHRRCFAAAVRCRAASGHGGVEGDVGRGGEGEEGGGPARMEQVDCELAVADVPLDAGVQVVGAQEPARADGEDHG